MLEEYNVLDCDCNNRHWYDPLDVLSRFPMGRKFTFCKTVRLRGFIHSSTVKDFLRLLVWGKYPIMQYILIHTTLPPCDFRFDEI